MCRLAQLRLLSISLVFSVIMVLILPFTFDGMLAVSATSEASTLARDVQESDRIITGMVTDKEIIGNTEFVWISIYEWLKNEVTNAGQIILDFEGPTSSSTKVLDFVIGEEVILMLDDIDVVNGHFGLYHSDAEKPSKYSITMRNEVVSLVEKFDTKTPMEKEEEEFARLLNQSGSENCRITELKYSGKDSNIDKFFYCTYAEEYMRFYVPIAVSLEHVKQGMLKHASEQYLVEHFNLKRAWDEAFVNGEAEPEAQMLEFEYSLDNLTFAYYVRVNLGFEEDDHHLLYMSYFPPREISNPAVHDRNQIDEIVYNSSCLERGTPYVLDDPVALSHVDRGFSPLIGGRGPPDVIDRYANQIRDAEKRFQIWVDNGEIQCTSNVKQDDDMDNTIDRQDQIVLMDASDYVKASSESKPISDATPNFATEYFPAIIGIGAAIAGIIAFITLRKRN